MAFRMNRRPDDTSVPVLNRALPDVKPKVPSRIEIIPPRPVIRSKPVILQTGSGLEGNYKKMMDSVKGGGSNGAIEAYIIDKVNSKPVQKEMIIYDRTDQKWKLVTVVDET
jgi:hypothetical protein